MEVPYGERNIQVANEIFGLVENIGYGSTDFSLDVHNKRVTAWKVYGTRRWVFSPKNQIDAYKTILERVKKGESDKRTEKLVFVVNRVNGVIKDIELTSEINRNYEDLQRN